MHYNELQCVEQGAHQEVNRLSGRLYEQSAELERMKKTYENEIDQQVNYYYNINLWDKFIHHSFFFKFIYS